MEVILKHHIPFWQYHKAIFLKLQIVACFYDEDEENRLDTLDLIFVINELSDGISR